MSSDEIINIIEEIDNDGNVVDYKLESVDSSGPNVARNEGLNENYAQDADDQWDELYEDMGVKQETENDKKVADVLANEIQKQPFSGSKSSLDKVKNASSLFIPRNTGGKRNSQKPQKTEEKIKEFDEAEEKPDFQIQNFLSDYKTPEIDVDDILELEVVDDTEVADQEEEEKEEEDLVANYAEEELYKKVFPWIVPNDQPDTSDYDEEIPSIDGVDFNRLDMDDTEILDYDEELQMPIISEAILNQVKGKLLYEVTQPTLARHSTTTLEPNTEPFETKSSLKSSASTKGKSVKFAETVEVKDLPEKQSVDKLYKEVFGDEFKQMREQIRENQVKSGQITEEQLKQEKEGDEEEENETTFDDIVSNSIIEKNEFDKPTITTSNVTEQNTRKNRKKSNRFKQQLLDNEL